MFKNAQIGDRVWNFIENWGTIIKINKGDRFPLEVIFDNGIRNTYTLDGKQFESDENPRLFWDKIKFKIPKKPFDLEEELKQLEFKEFVVKEFNYKLYWDNQTQKIKCNYGYWYENPSAIYFTEESVKKFMEKIKDKEITKEEFFKAYKLIF